MSKSPTTPSQMDQLPHHILSNILESVVLSDYPHCRSNLLKVCSTFYLDAIPFIYRCPRLSSHLSSFFLRADINPPADFQNLTSDELVRSGYLKLAALRYVQHLHFDDPEWYSADADPDLQMSEAQKLETELDEDMARKDDRSNALASARNLPDGAMPRLRAVQIGEIPYEWTRPEKAVPSGAKMRAVQLAACLLERTTPKIWCERPRPSAPLILPTRGLGSALAPQGSDLTFHMHVHVGDDFEIVPGGTNHIYIHKDSRSEYLIPRFRFDRQVSWIAQQIQRSFDGQDLRDPDVIARTRIYIKGIMVETAAGAQLGLPQSDQRDIAARRYFQSAVKESISRGSGGKCRALQDLSVEVRGTAETEPCPGCGLRV